MLSKAPPLLPGLCPHLHPLLGKLQECWEDVTREGTVKCTDRTSMRGQNHPQHCVVSHSTFLSGYEVLVHTELRDGRRRRPAGLPRGQCPLETACKSAAVQRHPMPPPGRNPVSPFPSAQPCYLYPRFP